MSVLLESADILGRLTTTDKYKSVIRFLELADRVKRDEAIRTSFCSPSSETAEAIENLFLSLPIKRKKLDKS